ncbi:valine--tRNA ligase [Francisellaceae bacterium]|nr:valine--tRNA ligase [Francisellaceae bacterium]
MSEINKNYDPKSIEKSCYQSWENQGHFKCGRSHNEPYTIMLPPPNVTGTLHMGHGFQHTLMDILTRYHRMMGNDTLWQPGTDHAGIATQMVVERKLNAENISRHDLGRKAFIDKVWEWKNQSGGTITSQMRRLGTSVDWSREKFTMDDDLSIAVREQFIRLYDEGLIYRGQKLVNWDPVLKTAVSDLEVVNEDAQGSLWHFDYPLSDGSGFLTIATTRPETMLGDMAVAVNPNDVRYQHLIGQSITLPITNRFIQIIADEYVDMDFGTGCVKITPAHDFNDYEMGHRHGLAMINIFAPDATMTNVPQQYVGLDRFVAREKIVSEMQSLGLLRQIEPHQLKIPKGDRTGAILEPYLTEQWFVKMHDLAQPAIQAVETGEVKFIPDNWKNTYYSWMRDIQDWCISRQLWWGHRIPAWYDCNGNVYVAHTEVEVRAKYRLGPEIFLTQDEDVFDTWFSSALWPLSTLGWPNATPELQKYYPTNSLVTGFDIIFFWVARMIMMGLKFMNKAPFSEIYITGLIRDAEGQKMSKSKGNVLDPVDLIDGITLEALINKRTSGLMQPSPQVLKRIESSTRKEFPEGIPAFGTDALRFTFAALASTSRDICFDISRMEGYRNFCNKLWNASRFVLMNVEGHETMSSVSNQEMYIPEQWIWHELNKTIVEVHYHIKHYRFDLMAQSIYEFVWNEYCSWYVELAKFSLNSPTTPEKHKQAVRFTLISVLDSILRLTHPIIPFITEELYKQVTQVIGLENLSIMNQQFPRGDDELVNHNAANSINWLKEIIIGIRTIRSEMNIKPSQPIPLIIKNGNQSDFENFTVTKSLIQSLTKVSNIQWLTIDTPTPPSSTALVNHIELHIPLEGLIDIQAEKSRIEREQAKIDKELDRLLNKLSNQKFIANAPTAVVEKEKEKSKMLEEQKYKLQKQLEKILTLPR